MGFVGYITFVVAWAEQKTESALEVSAVWSVLSLATMFAPLLWGGLLARWSGTRVLALAMMLSGMGAALPFFGTSLFALIGSAALFGSAFLIPPAAVTNLGKAELPQIVWGAWVARFTAAFGIGQIVSPLMVGWFADRYAGLAPGFAVSAGILVIGGARALAQRSAAIREKEIAIKDRLTLT